MRGRPSVRPSVATAPIRVVAEPKSDPGQVAKSLLGSLRLRCKVLKRTRAPMHVYLRTVSTWGHQLLRPGAFLTLWPTGTACRRRI